MKFHLQKFAFLGFLLIASISVAVNVAAQEPNELKAFDSDNQFFSRDLAELSKFPLIYQRSARQQAGTQRLVSQRRLTSPEQSLEFSRVDIRVSSVDVPQDLATAEFKKFGAEHHAMGTSRFLAPIDCQWKSPAFCRRPLYFEQVALERYGITNKVAQPMLSAARFYGTVPLLPLLSLKDVPQHRPSTLGYKRPGSPLR